MITGINTNIVSVGCLVFDHLHSSEPKFENVSSFFDTEKTVGVQNVFL